MILYRIQISNINDDDSWSNEWFPTQALAFSMFATYVDDVGFTNDVHLDEVEVPTGKTSVSGRANVAYALNAARSNRDVWPGKELKRHNGAQRAAAADELLS